MAEKVKPIPPGYHSVTAYLVVSDAAKAIDFYKQAFGATERGRMGGPQGKIAHAELLIGDSIVMLSDEMMGNKSPQTLGGDMSPLRKARRSSHSFAAARWARL